MVDNLGGRLGSFDRIERALPAGEQWSACDKGIGGGAYFAAPGSRLGRGRARAAPPDPSPASAASRLARQPFGHTCAALCQKCANCV